jgi:DNA adenine methylase
MHHSQLVNLVGRLDKKKKQVKSMTAYKGGKKRLGKAVAKEIMKFVPHSNVEYFEPFVGMCGVLQHIPLKNRTGCDIHDDLMLLLQQSQQGWKPPAQVTEDDYKILKYLFFPDPLRAFVGFGMSYGGSWFDGFARNKFNTDFCARATTSLKKVVLRTQGVKFLDARSYDEHDWIDRDLIIYCDPPYRGTKSFVGQGTFDSNKMWNQVRVWSENNTVIVSEQAAPEDFVVVWEKEVSRTINASYVGQEKGDSVRATEKLFVHESFWEL